MPRARARSQASCATLAGSAPGAPWTRSAPARWAQMVNWSAAAARKVSQAASKSVFPWSFRRWASLAIEVVLPEPLTPAIR